ncbi:hypothetical protein [Chitinimonas sp. BJYL2]|uniref:hypothetical protein n=1 Tax=Chitinimonas sp. BJYL2 TaxID=2976696 RepID=UPI0022B58FA4|nr:hypothetical protein [Chitinimonas sp. BJYL2]
MKLRAGLMLLAALLNGCAVMGPSTISSNRPAYNQAVQRTNDQELLLNLVRILYRDTTYFTTVERIAASYEFNRGISGGAGWQSAAGAISRSLNLDEGSFAINEQPTVFYAPVEGEKFVRQMMTPMNPDLLLMLVKSGWSLDRVFSIGVQEMNGLRNAPSASGPTPALEPEFRGFKEAVRLLRVLLINGLIELGRSQEGDGLEVRLSPAAENRPETIRIKELLGLEQGRSRFRIVPGTDKHDPNTIAISTRPLISALSYLAQGIDAPAADRKSGKVRQTLRHDGAPFDWQELLEGVFQVRSSATPPDNASVAIAYRGSYFYIADDDLESKSTFVLLNQLMALNATPAGSGSAMNFTFGK